MPEPVTELRPHQQVLLVAVLKQFLDPDSSRQLANDVLGASIRKRGVPVVLDMSKVRFAPSSALGALVQLSRNFKLDNRRLILIGVTPQVLGPMRVTNLHAVVEVYDTLDSFLSSQPPPA